MSARARFEAWFNLKVTRELIKGSMVFRIPASRQRSAGILDTVVGAPSSRLTIRESIPETAAHSFSNTPDARGHRFEAPRRQEAKSAAKYFPGKAVRKSMLNAIGVSP